MLALQRRAQDEPAFVNSENDRLELLRLFDLLSKMVFTDEVRSLSTMRQPFHSALARNPTVDQSECGCPLSSSS